MGKIVKLKNANNEYTYPVTKTEAVYIEDNKTTLKDYLDAMSITQSAGPAEVVTFNDGANNIPVKNLTLNIEPHQSGSGDPSPDNVRSISGYQSVKMTRTGKNLIKPLAKTESGLTLTPQTDGSLIINGTFTGTTEAWLVISSNFKIKAGCTYMPSIGAETSPSQIVDYGLLGFGTSKPITHTSDFQTSLRLRIAAGAVFNNIKIYPMLEAGSTATDFNPYITPTEYEITIPSAAGTVYGGSLEINEDGSGTLTVDSYGFEITAANVRNYQEITEVFYVDTPNRPTDTEFAAQPVGLYCDRLPSLSRLSVRRSKKQGICYDTGVSRLQFCLPGITPLEDAQTWLTNNPLMVVYRLASPLVYTFAAGQVTTLLRNNTIWMDGDGTISLKYNADLAKYITNIISSNQGD